MKDVKRFNNVVTLVLLVFIACMLLNVIINAGSVREIIRHNMRLEELQSERDRNEVRLKKQRQAWIETLGEGKG